MDKVKKTNTKIILIPLAVLLVIYVSMTMYFRTHFYFRTVINGVNVSCKTLEESAELLSSNTSSYTLDLFQRGGSIEQIKASDISLKFASKDQVKSFKEKQNSVSWFASLIKSNELKLENGVTYDENLLKEKFDKLSCLDSKNVTEPQSAELVYSEEDNSYNIIKEVNGNKINKDTLYSGLVKAIMNGEKEFNLETAGCYENPKFRSDSQKVQDDQKLLNKYVNSKIKYNYNTGSVTVDGAVINKWLIIDKNLEVSFDNKKVRSFVYDLSGHYNTYGKTRDFATSLGSTVKVRGGDYGWRVSVTGEIQALIENIKAGQVITKEPVYLQKGLANGPNDIGNTYVEINLTKQHLWFYKDGKLITDGDVVTGNVSKGNGTPTGVYRLKYKDKDAVLEGEDYETPVNYWMPFNNNIGLHDATWRNKFGGDIYLSRGSHGCVNAPYSLAQTVFNNIASGTPMVCYN